MAAGPGKDIAFECVAPRHRQSAGGAGIVTVHQGKWGWCPNGAVSPGRHQWVALAEPLTLAELQRRSRDAG